MFDKTKNIFLRRVEHSKFPLRTVRWRTVFLANSFPRTVIRTPMSLSYFAKNTDYLSDYAKRIIQNNIPKEDDTGITEIHPELKLLSVKVLVTQLCPTLCDPMDCSPPGYFIHGILQARILEWVAIPFSRRSSWIEAGSLALQADSLPSEPPGKPSDS